MQEATLKANAKPEKIVMHCPRAPQDNRSQRGEATGTRAGDRHKRTESVLSIRVGCGVHFAACRQSHTPDITEILYYHWVHSECCKASTPVSAVMYQNSYVTGVMAERKAASRDDGLKTLSAQQMPRKFISQP